MIFVFKYCLLFINNLLQPFCYGPNRAQGPSFSVNSICPFAARRFGVSFDRRNYAFALPIYKACVPYASFGKDVNTPHHTRFYLSICYGLALLPDRTIGGK